MREHKYRAWDKERKIMRDVSKLVFNGILYIYYFDGFRHIPIKAKLREWTGFQDKNGKDIYEGDIVKTELYCGCEYCSKTIELIKEVRFVNGRFIIEGIYEVTKEDYYDLVYFGGLALEVIGNKFENPELLKE